MTNKDKIFQLDKSYSTTRMGMNKNQNTENKYEDSLHLRSFLSKNPEWEREGGLRKKGYFKKTYKNIPLISIVTVVYNGEQHLEQTIKSVLDQTYNNVEHIIIDGCSTDNTLAIIKKYDEYIDYWLSEPDAGIYNAMNKAIGLCTGDYVAFLNADDWYEVDTLKSIAGIINKYNSDYIFGDVNIINNNTVLMVRPAKLHKYKIDTPFCHQSLFLKRSILEKFGFDENYKIIADHNLMIQLIKNNYSYYYLNEVVVNYRDIGISSTFDLNKVYFRLMYDNFGLLHAVYRYIIRNNNPVLFFFGKSLLKFLKKLGFHK